MQKLRKAIPNILLQMLFRGSNAVGYKAYPDNLIEKFIIKASEEGIDVFRIFDSLNWIEGMKKSIQVVREKTNSIAEAAICYTGDVLNQEVGYKYNLQYYLDLARQLEDQGAHILAIKDMAGLLKPYAAEILIPALKETVDIPIHLHTHDTSSIQAATLVKAIEADVDIIDVCLSSLSGLTSQPNFNSMVAVMQGHEREQPMNLDSLNQYANYWEDVREYYQVFESGLKAGTAEVYDHEIPGGQYSNLRPQAIALGLEHKFEEIKQYYAIVNRMFGDIVKVTPSSKVVGDMALFMVSNDLTEEDIMKRGETLAFPDSVIDLFKGNLGQTKGGFPAKLSKIILKDGKPFTDTPNSHLQPIDFESVFAEFKQEFDDDHNFLDFLSFMMYPDVYRDFHQHKQLYGEVTCLPSPAFFYGLKEHDEILVELSKGKTLIIRLEYCSEPNDEGMRTISFELNGQHRSITIYDNAIASPTEENRKAETDYEIGAPLQGRISAILVEVGAEIKQNDPLFVIEAMKMETTVLAPFDGIISQLHLSEGAMVKQQDLVVEFTD